MDERKFSEYLNANSKGINKIKLLNNISNFSKYILEKLNKEKEG